MNIPKPGDIVRYKRTGKLYLVIKETSAKQGYDDWVSSINYAPADGSEGDYTRDTDFFCSKFEPV